MSSAKEFASGLAKGIRPKKKKGKKQVEGDVAAAVTVAQQPSAFVELTADDVGLQNVVAGPLHSQEELEEGRPEEWLMSRKRSRHEEEVNQLVSGELGMCAATNVSVPASMGYVDFDQDEMYMVDQMVKMSVKLKDKMFVLKHENAKLKAAQADVEVVGQLRAEVGMLRDHESDLNRQVEELTKELEKTRREYDGVVLSAAADREELANLKLENANLLAGKQSAEAEAQAKASEFLKWQEDMKEEITSNWAEGFEAGEALLRRACRSVFGPAFKWKRINDALEGLKSSFEYVQGMFDNDDDDDDVEEDAAGNTSTTNLA